MLQQTLSAQNRFVVPDSLCTEPSHFDLQEVVVSGSGLKLQGENVVNVEKLNLYNNPDIQGFSLAEKLSGVAGVSNLSTGVGIGKPVIRGLSGNRVAVFAQGVRMENQQWGDEHGLGLDENGYGQVEIIKGPASLLYGSDALGGVLYFSDERYAAENALEGSAASEYNSNTKGWRNTGALKATKDRLHWNLFGGYTTHEDYQDGAGNRVNNSRFHTGDFKSVWGYTGQKFNTSLKYSFLNEQYGLTETEDGEDSMIPNGRQPKTPYQNLTTHIISSENTYIFENNSRLKFDAGYVFNNRKELEEEDGEAVASLNMNLGTWSYNAKWYSPKWNERWSLVAGSQGMYQTNANRGEEQLIPDATTTDAGVFVMSDYYYSGKSYWQAGVRVDGRHIGGTELSTSYTAFSFSTGVYQQLNRKLSLRANLSSGYRAPNMFELLSDGVHEGTNRYEIGNVQLQTENSYQVDVALRYDSEHLALFVNPYFNYIRRYIYLKPAGEMRDDFPVYNYVQGDAYLYGGEAGFHFHPHPWDWLHLEGSYSNAFGQNDERDPLPLMPSQKLNATVRIHFQDKKNVRKISFYLHGLQSFAQNRTAAYETATPAYHVVDAGALLDWKLAKQTIRLNVAANNLFNAQYYDHLSRYKQEGIYNIGRNFVARVSLVF
ncbi:MAG: TonB-dependent receptor [Dysgonamonadaceae bacterium]|nr:TonB-dependent receptor [Dysgonamonadaceae bacterium]